ncbi:MAG: stringent starvation protein [Panacagrimonas sp.]|jgi:RNA polymerase-associated protein|nr:glutathione S-transferase N-terminal domain-containing protein [Panacagrimonas sp.]MCC2655621.1 stringent starvation protein [Panacagrimonas sp.]
MSLRAKSKYVPAAKPASNAGVTLYCSPDKVGCHWVRMVLAEKDVPGARVLLQVPGHMSEDLAQLNPAQTLPTLTDRETVIYPARLIAEFLDERYPHPPMMPPEAATRARLRMAMCRLEEDWLELIEQIETGPAAPGRVARKRLADQLAASARLFPARGWFLGLEFSIADCAWAALLWRLASLKLQLPGGGEPIRRYAERVFARPGFARSLVDSQRAAAARGK